MKCVQSPRLVVAGVLLFSLLASACGPSRPPLYPFTGKVTYKGKPTPGAQLILHPVGSEDPNAPQPSGVVKDDGSFALSTFQPGDGAPAGDYKVAIIWIEAKAKADRDAELPNKLPAKYADVKQSGLTLKVEKSQENHKDFELK
jgi:hypothetical protein